MHSSFKSPYAAIAPHLDVVRQVVPGVRLAEAAPLPVVGVRGQPVIPAPLNVDGGQVEGDGVGDLKPVIF